jgi:hypothetical protein
MPLPENSRITIPRFTPETVGDHYGNNRELDRWAANLPFFKQHTVIDRSVGSGGAVTFTVTTPTWGYFPSAGGIQISEFKKFEPWTSVNVRASVQFQITNNKTLEIGVRFTGSATTALVRDYWLSGMYGASSSTHHVLTGEITIDGYFLPPASGAADQTYYPSTAFVSDSILPVDTYRVDLIGRVMSGATVTLDQYDNCFLSIIETC